MSTKVLFIAGAGRSGTTFLSLVLSQHGDTQNVGQIRDLPQAMAQAAPCSCGASVPDCAVWRPVRAGFEARFGAGALADLALQAVAFRKAANQAGSWQEARVRRQLARDHAPYLDRLAVLYALTAQECGGRMLIDSSKSVEIALALGLIPEIDLHVLNLVRDPRAVAVSWSKVLKKEDKLKRRTRDWRGRQRRLEQLQQQDPQALMVLRYEDLTDHPKEWIGKIQTWAGLPAQLDCFISRDTATISWDRAHLFPPGQCNGSEGTADADDHCRGRGLAGRQTCGAARHGRSPDLPLCREAGVSPRRDPGLSAVRGAWLPLVARRGNRPGIDSWLRGCHRAAGPPLRAQTGHPCTRAGARG